jgi:hypothetical protein
VLCCQNFIRPRGSSQIHALLVSLGWVTYPFHIYRAEISIDACYIWWNLIDWIYMLPLEWLIRAVGGCMVVGRKVGLTQLNGWTRLMILLIVHSLDDSMRVWSAHAVDVEMLSVRTRGRWQCTFASLVSFQAMMCELITVRQSIRELHLWLKMRMIGVVTIHQRTISVVDRSGDDRTIADESYRTVTSVGWP